jgi:CTP:molybdopterin cytidylyltransferase MocA
VEAIVMAAGEGTRLRPLTETWPKPVLPIDGRPVIATLLRELTAAGVARATVVSGHLADELEALVGDGTGFGLQVDYVRQPRADGSGDAVRRALAGGAATPALVAVADTVYRPGDLARFSAAFESSGAEGAVAVRRDPPASAERPPVRIEPDATVSLVVDDDPGNPLGSAALWGLGAAVARELHDLPGPPYELAGAYQRAIDAGARVIGFEIGPTRDLTRPVDLIRENFPYLSKGT